MLFIFLLNENAGIKFGKTFNRLSFYQSGNAGDHRQRFFNLHMDHTHKLTSMYSTVRTNHTVGPTHKPTYSM